MSERSIPIANIFYLFCYAWNRFREAGAIRSAIEDAPDTSNLFARALYGAVEQIRVRALDRAYVEREDELRGVRGKIDLTATVLMTPTRRGMVSCVYSELEHDVLSNQIIKATI